MNKYNLDEMLATKSEKQITALISKRIEKESESWGVISKYDDGRWEDSRKHVAMVKKAKLLNADCHDWLDAAFINFSEDLWNRMVIQADGCLECFGHREMTDYNS